MGLNLSQDVDCPHCGFKATITLTTKETKYSKSVKVSKCSNCKRQSGVRSILTQFNLQ